MDEGCGAGLEVVANSETGAACDLFSDDKNGSAVEAVVSDVSAGVGGKE